MARCNQMAEVYTIANAGIYSGDVKTKSNTGAEWYEYDPIHVDAGNQWHFTLGRTGFGQGEQKSMGSMHMTIILKSGGGVANGHIFFNSTGLITGNNDHELSSLMRAKFIEYREQHQADIEAAVQSMASQLV